MRTRSGKTLAQDKNLKLPRKSCATILPTKKTAPKRKSNKQKKAAPGKPPRSAGPHPVPPSPDLVASPAAASHSSSPMPSLPSAENASPFQTEPRKRFPKLNAHVTKTWLLETFDFDQSVDVYRDSAIDGLFRHWLHQNVDGEVWQEKKLNELSMSVSKNAKDVFSQAAQIAGVNPPTISDNGGGQPKMLRRVRPKDEAVAIMERCYPENPFVLEKA